MGESGAVPGVPPRDGEVSDVSASAPDAPDGEAADGEAADGEAADEALDDALRELFAESRDEDRREPPVVFMPWYRGVPGLL